MTIKTLKYEFSTGHKPRGYGLWAFNIAGNQYFFQGTWTECKLAATQQARSLGADTVEVLP